MIPGYAFRLAVNYTLIALALGGISPLLGFGAVVINEIMADPASDWDGDGAYQFRDDEWVEMLNTGPETVDLTEYGLKDASADGPRVQLSGTLQPGQTRVVFGSEAVAWQEAGGSTVAGLSLNNGGDVLELLYLGGEEAQVVDSITYQDHEAEDDRAGGRLQDTLAWVLFDALNPHNGTQEPLGTGCAPSPGAPNLCVPQVSAEALALGSLKSRFR